MKTGVRTQQELVDWMAQEQSVVDPLDKTVYTIFLIPRMEDGRGIFILKSHHSQGDGLAFSSFFHALSDHYDGSALPGLKPLTLPQKLVMTALKPWLIIKGVKRLLYDIKNDHNAINAQRLTGKKQGCQRKIDMQKMKAYAKHKGVTVNDVATGILSLTMKDYFK